jgi:hypothetical protein
LAALLLAGMQVGCCLVRRQRQRLLRPLGQHGMLWVVSTLTELHQALLLLLVLLQQQLV